MADISRIKIKDTVYSFKDAVARGEEEEAEGISCFELDGEVYDYKDAVARGEGEAEAREISKVSVGGKVYQIKDAEARESISGYNYYFAVYSADDASLTFYGANALPSGTYKGKTVTELYEDVENMGTGIEGYMPWDEIAPTFETVVIDTSFRGARPQSCHRWFCQCMNVTTIDGLSNLDTSNVTDMMRMFEQCRRLTTLDLSNFDTSNVTDMSAMFGTCYALTALDLSNFNTSNVTDMQSMFSGCTALTTLDVSNFDTSNVTDMSFMFSMCTALTTIYSDDAKFVTTAVTDSLDMFNSCTALVGGNGTAFDSDKTDHTMAHIDTASNPGYFTEAKK